MTKRTKKTTNYSTPEERQRAKELHEQGLTIQAIATELNRGATTISTWLDGREVYRIQDWKGKATDAEKAEAVKLYSELRNIQKVCEQVDRSYETVRRWLKNAGVDCSQKRCKSKKNKEKKRIAELEKENQELRTQAHFLELEKEIDELRSIVTQFIIQ